MATKVKVTTTPFDSIIAKANATLQGLSVAKQRSIASNQAKAQIAPQIAAQTNANTAQNQLLQNLYNSQTGFALAMAKLADPNGQQALGDYTAAASTLGALGQGITGQAGQDFQNAANQASQTAASLTGGQGSVQGLYDPSGLASSGYATGYALPGASLADQAVTAASDARNRQLASANNLGVMAAQTQANQAQTAQQGAQALAAIRAQQPGIFQTALQNQQQNRQQALDTLGSLTGNRASFLQNRAQNQQQAKQFGITEAETKKTDAASIANAAANTAIAKAYLKQAGIQIGGKVTAQNLANRANQIALTGIDPKTGKLAAGWVSINGQPIQYSAYASSIANQARLAMYKDEAAGRSASAHEKLVDTANSLLKTTTTGSKTQPTFQYIPTYDKVTGKRTGTKAVMTRQGTTPTVVPYKQMLGSVLALKPDDPAWVKQATAMVNARYPVGKGGRPMEPADAIKYAAQAANVGVKRRYTAREVLQTLTSYEPISSLTPAQIAAVVGRIYTPGGKASPLYGPPAPGAS